MTRALDELFSESLTCDLKLLERMPRVEARERYMPGDIIIDQIITDEISVLTFEAWALSKTCITYLREELFQPICQSRDLPVANALPDAIKDVRQRLIRGYARREHPPRGREAAESIHDIEKVAAQYLDICRQQTALAASRNH